MKVSGEIRWFWARKPAAVVHWFHASPPHPCKTGGGAGPPRSDEYLVDPGQDELGIKHRGSTGGKKPKGPEVKGLVVEDLGQCKVGPFAGTMELWAKWESNTLVVPTSQRIIRQKTRWLRKFDTTGPRPLEIALDENERPLEGALPNEGCNVELTKVQLDAMQEWWR